MYGRMTQRDTLINKMNSIKGIVSCALPLSHNECRFDDSCLVEESHLRSNLDGSLIKFKKRIDQISLDHKMVSDYQVQSLT